MSARIEARLLARLTDAAGIAGSRGRTVVSWLDIARSAGARRTLARARREAGALPRAARDAVYREIWADAAARIGAELEDLGAGFLVGRRAGAETKIWQQLVALDDPVTLRLALDKGVVHRVLSAARIPVPEHREVDFVDVAAALGFIQEAAPCVVKAASGTGGGEGTTGGVDTPVHFMRARLRAGRFDTRLLIERQVPGAVYRLLFLDGELIDTIRHLPPRLVGDGRSTISDLVDAENERRIAARGALGLSLLDVGLDALFMLERQHVTPGSVPAAGEVVQLQTVTNDNRIEDTETWTGPLAPALVESSRRATAALGIRLAGVDVITPDPGRSLEDAGGVVVEVNGTPGIHHHYQVADRRGATRVAVPILERALESAALRARVP